ncbi:MAG TPA: hypothetical protein PKO22_01460 [Treponemataceae bacterium]|nr:hypothetical protein [Treponemataceae bacterium]
MTNSKSTVARLAAFAAGTALNLALIAVTRSHPEIPLFMDTMGTVAATLVGGLIPGMLVGFATNLGYCAMCALSNPPKQSQLLFALCNVASAVVVWLFFRKRGTNNPVFDLFILCVAVTIVNSVLGGVISFYRYGGMDRFPTDYMVAGMLLQDIPPLSAAIASRLPINLLDKTIAVLGGYGLYLAAQKTKLWGSPDGDQLSQSQVER